MSQFQAVPFHSLAHAYLFVHSNPFAEACAWKKDPFGKVDWRRAGNGVGRSCDRVDCVNAFPSQTKSTRIESTRGRTNKYLAILSIAP